MNMSNEGKIDALEAELKQFKAEYDAATDPIDRRGLRQLLAEIRRTLNKLLDALEPASSSTAATEARGKHLSPSL